MRRTKRESDVTATASQVRQATVGEMIGMLIAAACVLPLIVVSALTESSGYAFHAALGIVAAAAAVILIANRCFDGSPAVSPQEIGGKPNYNMEPVKFATVAAMVWGIAGFTVGLIIALQLAFPVLN